MTLFLKDSEFISFLHVSKLLSFSSEVGQSFFVVGLENQTQRIILHSEWVRCLDVMQAIAQLLIELMDTTVHAWHNILQTSINIKTKDLKRVNHKILSSRCPQNLPDCYPYINVTESLLKTPAAGKT